MGLISRVSSRTYRGFSGFFWILGEAMFFKEKSGAAGKHQRLWQDREIQFDVSEAKLKLRPGETMITKFNQVEDTKGNNGEMGKLVITNVRLIWTANRYKRINLSVGLNNILSITVKSVHSRLRGGDVQSLALLTQQHSAASKTRYEFQFTILTDVHSGLKDSSIHNVLKASQAAYDRTRLFREVKLRAVNLTQPGSKSALNLLHGEQVIHTIDGVWSLSSDSGNLGQLILTNIRVIWLARLVQDYNLTVPWCSISTVAVKDSKFDKALVIDTYGKGINDVASQSYTLGFRLDNTDRLNSVLKNMEQLLTTFRTQPIFGVDIKEDKAFQALIEESKVKDGYIGKRAGAKLNDTTHDSPGDDISASTYIDSTIKAKNYEVFQNSTSNVDKSNVKYFYCQELGLAVQELQPGQSLDSLWKYDLPDISMDF